MEKAKEGFNSNPTGTLLPAERIRDRGAASVIGEIGVPLAVKERRQGASSRGIFFYENS